MDVFAARQLLKTKSIFEMSLRVTFYARVSTDSDEQQNSLENQISYYENFIKQNPSWVYVPGYVDEGISGISVKKRKDFNRMIADANEGLFDMIITKEISRFARNTIDSLKYTRELLNVGVGVFFQNDNINTIDTDGELRLSIMSSIAQDELRKLSERVRFGHQQAVKKGVVLGNNRITGFVKNNKALVIDEESSQATMVRELFELYATDSYSLKQIENIFWEKGYRNTKGKKISHTTLSGIITNPKYKGYYVGNRTRIVDIFTKKQRVLPPEEWVIFKDETGLLVPAIVSEELWDRANKIFQRRSNDVKNRKGISNHENLLTGKVFCTCCGAPYYRKASVDTKGNANSTWVCSHKISNGKNSCPSFGIYEEEIKPIIYEVIKDATISADVLIEEYIRLYEEINNNAGIPSQIKENKSKLVVLEQKQSKILEYNVLGKITDDEFLRLTRQISSEIDAITERIKDLERQASSDTAFRTIIKEIRSVLNAAKKDATQNVITRDFVNRYVDRIFATPLGDNKMHLDIKIYTGEQAEIILSHIRNRSELSSDSKQYEIIKTSAPESSMGQIFKNKCTIRHFQYDRNSRTLSGHKRLIHYSASFVL